MFAARVQSAESSSAAARTHRILGHREAACWQVRRQPAQQRTQCASLHPRTDAELSRPLCRRQRPQRLGPPGEHTAFYLAIVVVSLAVD